MDLKIGKVYQAYANNTFAGPFILKSLPWEGWNLNDYWYNRVNLYTIDDKWSHTAHIKSLSNFIPSNPQMVKEILL